MDFKSSSKLEELIVGEECEQFDEKCIVCILTLKNGYKVSGTYTHTGDGFLDNAMGEKIARQQAVDKIYELEAYLEQQKYYDMNLLSDVIESEEETSDSDVEDIYVSGYYNTIEVKGLDMFPHTQHIEMFCVLERR